MAELGCDAIYSCQDEFELMGDIVRTCTITKSGTAWSGIAPNCEWTQNKII